MVPPRVEMPLPIQSLKNAGDVRSGVMSNIAERSAA